MKPVYILFTFLLASCDIKIRTMQEHQRLFEETAQRKWAWEHLVDSLSQMTDTNHVLALQAIDQLIAEDSATGRVYVDHLYFMKGKIYYKLGSLSKALHAYSIAIEGGESPDYLVGRAEVYIKRKEYDKALKELKYAAGMNYDYFWYVGNYFEVRGKRDSAIVFYDKLYQKDTSFYKYPHERILELRNPKTKLLTELYWRQ